MTWPANDGPDRLSAGAEPCGFRRPADPPSTPGTRLPERLCGVRRNVHRSIADGATHEWEAESD